MSPFFVTGYPRSRSAWLANWLTAAGTICFHDVPYTRTRADRMDKRVGFSGSELAAQFDQVQADYPDARWVVIQREPESALAAFLAWAEPDFKLEHKVVRRVWESKARQLARITASPRTLVADYERLYREDVCCGIWNYLLPGERFDAERWQMLVELNVQQNKAIAAARRGLSVAV